MPAIGRPRNAIGGSDGRLDRAHVNRREGEGVQASGPRRRPRRDPRLQLPEAGRTAAERQEGHRRRGHRQEAAADAGELVAAERGQARHPGPPGALGGSRRPRAHCARAQERRADRASVARHAGWRTGGAAAEAERFRAEAAREDRGLPHQEGGHQGAVLGGRGAGAHLGGGERRGRADGRRRAGHAARDRQDRKHESARRRRLRARSRRHLRRPDRAGVGRRRHRPPAQAALQPVRGRRRARQDEG